VIYGFRSFKEAVLLNKSCRHHNIPFYVLNTSGLFGFFYIDIG
jgi:molybdopterin/thiamine biosynthesis adenylyltransferase